MASQQSSGDFDIQFTSATSAGEFDLMNKNYYDLNMNMFKTRQ